MVNLLPAVLMAAWALLLTATPSFVVSFWAFVMVAAITIGIDVSQRTRS